MHKKLVFDTLELAKLLEKGGVAKADIHAASLATAITQNIYVKDEVDEMFEAALAKSDATLAKFDTSLNEFKLALERDRLYHDHEMTKLENRMERKFDKFEVHIEQTINRSIYTIITILGALIVTVGAIATFSHYFIH